MLSTTKNSTDSLYALMGSLEKEEIGLLREASNFLKCAPKGRLYCEQRGNKKHYRQRIIKDGKIHDRFLNKHDSTLIDDLALKQYYQTIEIICVENLQAIKAFSGKYIADICDVALKECTRGVGERVAAILDKREAWMVDWSNGSYKQSQYKPEERNIKTLSGVYVRTKSEEKIADKLFLSGLAFRYEQAIVIGGELRYPDFVILHPLSTPTRKILIIWEHAGMMDDLHGYEPAAMNKLRLYADSGLIVNLNMILTTETRRCRLSTDTVDLEIRRLMGMIQGSPVIEVDGVLEIAD